jgi:hypothetical protein
LVTDCHRVKTELKTVEFFRRPITLPRFVFRFASREKIRLVENGLLYVSVFNIYRKIKSVVLLFKFSKFFIQLHRWHIWLPGGHIWLIPSIDKINRVESNSCWDLILEKYSRKYISFLYWCSMLKDLVEIFLLNQ